MSLLLAPLAQLAERVGLRPDSEMLSVAMTHSSFAAEHHCTSNERLEFLGDAVVDLAVADLIMTQYPHLDEGSGSLVRSRVVNEGALARAAQRLDLAQYVRVGRGEVKSNGLERPSLLADAFEALVAAIYLESGFESSKSFVHTMLANDVELAAANPDDVDPKTRLRQWAEAQGHGTPVYGLSESGPQHARAFEATVSLEGRVLAHGSGRSKKHAESEAARAAWEGRTNA